MEGAVQAKMGWLRGWDLGGGAQQAKGTQEIGLQTQTRPNGMGRRLQGWARWATAVRGWLISATTIGKECWTVLIKYSQYNNRAMNESNRIAEQSRSTQLPRICQCTPIETQGAGGVGHAHCITRNSQLATHLTRSQSHSHSLVGGRTSHGRTLRLEGNGDDNKIKTINA